MEKEVWKTCVQNPNYAVSDLGRVKRIVDSRSSKAGKILKPSFTKGYLRLLLCPGYINCYVHTLVLEAFIGPRPKGMLCNHKNGKKEDNRDTNLEWTTQTENMRHAFRIGLVKTQVLTKKNIEAAKQLLKSGWWTQQQIADRFGISRAVIQRLKHNRCYNGTI